MLGARVLGKEGAALEALKGDGSGTAAIKLGPRVLGAQAAPAPPAPAPVVQQVVQQVEVPKAVVATGNRVAPPVPAPKGKAPEPALTEDEVRTRLAQDPNSWELVLKAEGDRGEKPRLAVAVAVLAVADLPTLKKPVPRKVRLLLERIAKPTLAQA